MSAGFDWLYGVRFIAAGCVLWFWRAEYRLLNWSVSSRPLLTGSLVAAVWVLEEATFGSGPKQPTLWPPWWWIAIRVMATAITVPIAEELAFRHFLQRRFTSDAFTAIDPRRVSLWCVGIAAGIFGALHGWRWPAGVFAGAIFGLDYRYRGSIGEAALSHGVANTLVAVYVLTTGNWQLW